jgi:hypothetical protein
MVHSAMKHITWILFTVFCSAFVQVQPVVESKPCTQCMSCPCPVSGACGASSCTGSASQAPLVFSVQEKASAARSVARKAVAAKKKFYSSFAGVPSRTATPAPSASAETAATDPLFVVQCRFLI